MPEGEAEEFLGEIGLATVSKSTLHRIPRALAARYEMRRETIEAAVRERDPIPQAAVTVQVSLDGVMVPQDGEYARPRGRKTDSPQPVRHEKRYGPPDGEDPPADGDECFGRSWHEGSVGTIAYFDAEGGRLKTTYLARMPEPHKATLVVQLEQELRSVIGRMPGNQRAVCERRCGDAMECSECHAYAAARQLPWSHDDVARLLSCR
jgi:hypothetical protein